LADAEIGVGGSWNRDGVIVFGPSPASPIFRVSADGGPAAGVTQLAEGHAGHSFPLFLPDGRHFLHYVNGTPTARGVYMAQLDGAEPRRLFDADSGAAYVSGHLLFLRQGRLLAHAFDVERLEVSGVPFSTGVEGVLNSLSPAISATPAGVIAVRLQAAAAEHQFVWVDRAGKELETVGDRDSAGPQWPNLSPDGSQLVLMRRGNGNSDIWLLELRRGLLSRLTDYPAENIFPIWSRDGGQIVFSSNRSRGEMGLYRRNVTGVGGDVLLLPTTPGFIFASDWSPDGQFLLYQKSSDETRADLWALPLVGTQTPVPVVQGKSDDRGGQFSPDGKWVAYRSNRSGRFEVYVQPFPGQGGQRQVSTGGGAQVRWRPDGRELFYIALDGRLMAAPIQFASDGPSVGIPVPLFATRIGRAVQLVGAQYVVSADGQRFLMNTFVQENSPAPIRLILNWKPRP
jgi:dipeptidyl aminopeptidase/acylaminoacyl peptidase